MASSPGKPGTPSVQFSVANQSALSPGGIHVLTIASPVAADEGSRSKQAATLKTIGDRRDVLVYIVMNQVLAAAMNDCDAAPMRFIQRWRCRRV